MTQENHDSHELRALPSASNDQGPSRKDAAGATSTRPVSSSSSTTVQERATTSTRMLWWPIFVFLFYTAFSLFPWITLCIMNTRPIRKEKSYHAVKSVTYEPAYWYAVNEKYFRTAEVFQSITAVITIPVTTAICSMACVAYMQAGSLRKSLTLRQSMALADQGWVSPRIINTFTKSGSLPLLCALVLTIIGSISQIVQNALVGQEKILARGRGGLASDELYINDIPGILEDIRPHSASDDHELVMQLRNLLESPYSSNDDANNWGIQYGPGENQYTNAREDGLMKGNIYSLIPSSFNAGVHPFAQYSPRINSSVLYVNITKDEFKENCRNETSNGGFYAKYERTGEGIDFEACMPTDLGVSPWKATRDRQDINEKLFLGIGPRVGYPLSEIRYWKLEAETSLGYFQLPGQVNDNTSSGLLDTDPIDPKSDQTERFFKRATNMSYVGDDPRYEQSNMGPLASVAIALFGRWSFLESRMTNASRFVFPSNDTYGTPEGETCIYRYPLGTWIKPACITYSDSADESDIYYQVRNFLDAFYDGTRYSYDLKESLNEALYMANKLWLGKDRDGYSTTNHQLSVRRDPGIPTIKPKISRTGVIVGSILLALHLIGLLLLTIYILVVKPWSNTMGAEVMLKMGMVYSDELARSQYETGWKETLNKLPGYIGDERPGEEIGRLGLGAPAGLSRRAGRRFELLI